MHLTDVGYPTGQEDFLTISEAGQKFASFVQHWLFTEDAYLMLQGIKPQSLAYALNDSPVGLAAWLVEKFRAWSDCQGDVEKRFTKDELLTNIMIYWVTETAGSAARMYLQNVRAMYAQPDEPKSAQKSEVPAAVASFPGDTAPVPREWAARNVNLERYTIMTKGGHFAALEEPELFVNDLREFFREFRR
ncbi:MAG: alpha/beta hydrolase [Candidatus Methanoperedens sp.]|nr:alpha/beta hydrolase [Candidatus Methanoperedens sp.]MCE8427856.1 alpha/beta hydrolase [Candidatus Methanoperedens sp.]